MVYSHLRVFFSQKQETAIFFLASVNTFANSPTNAIDFVCASSLWKNTRSSKSWFSCWLRYVLFTLAWIFLTARFFSRTFLTSVNILHVLYSNAISFVCAISQWKSWSSNWSWISRCEKNTRKCELATREVRRERNAVLNSLCPEFFFVDPFTVSASLAKAILSCCPNALMPDRSILQTRLHWHGMAHFLESSAPRILTQCSFRVQHGFPFGVYTHFAFGHTHTHTHTHILSLSLYFSAKNKASQWKQHPLDLTVGVENWWDADRGFFSG